MYDTLYFGGMIAEQIGAQVFLLTDCLINKGDQDISRYPQADFDVLDRYMRSLK